MIGVFDMELLLVGLGDELVMFCGVIVEDSCFGQPDALGNHLQTDALVVHRHEQLQGALQNFLPVGFHDLRIFIF